MDRGFQLSVTAPELAPAPPTVGDFCHLYCCDPDRGLCGADLRGLVDFGDNDSPEPYCVVCEDLVELICERCGE